MPGPLTYLLLLLACMLLIAGCINPTGSPPGSAVTTLPTNEPTPLPTIAVPFTPVVTSTLAIPVPVYTAPTYVTPYQTPYIPYSQPTYTPNRIGYDQAGYFPSTTNGYRPPGMLPDYATATYAVPEPSDPAAMVFQHYADQNFGIDYPTGWKITRSGNVQFTSASGRVSFTAEVGDFAPGLAGNYRLNPDISAVQNIVSREFPAYDPHNIISNYQSASIRGVPVTIYTVTLPGGSEAYTRYIMVSLHHVYWFTFAADAPAFSQLEQLRNYMFSTLTIADQV